MKIGAILPLTGGQASVGQDVYHGMALANEKINANGGINGKKLEIVVQDDESDVTKGISVYQNLAQVQDVKINVITISGITLGVMPLAEKDKTILFNVASASTKISSAGDYIFRDCILPQEDAKFLAKSIYDLGYHKIGIVVSNAEGTLSPVELFKKEYTAFGGEIIFEEKYEFNSKDYRDVLSKVKSYNPDAVYMSSYANEAGILLTQAKQLSVQPQWFANYFVGDPAILKVAGDSMNGLIFSHFFDANSNDPLVVEYQKEYRAKYGEDSEAYAALGYDATNIIASAMKNCKNPEDPECIKDELYKIKNYPGVTGLTSFDSNGDTSKQLILMTVKDGKFVRYGGGIQ